MKVKIGDTWYSSDDQPICIQVESHKEYSLLTVTNKKGTDGKIAFFPESDASDRESKLEWMKK
tara:strand:- start:493 stop:681 length:189 start_codon:yes stop_codon:yes gene_type:complete